ncbi:MAG: adenylate/guanylate cyclase domain-containing protein [Candidatus Latescibacteria bacterium]|nr:adenylate/guanylate cyclase domain-containing protein [Candidatus Latescibacterota bacterium]
MTDHTQSLEQQLERRIFHLETLHEIGREIYPLREVRAILRTAAMMICGTFGIPHVVCVYRKRSALLTLVYLKGFDRQEIEEALIALPEEMLEIRDGKRVHVLNTDEGDATERLFSCGVNLWLPLRIDRETSAGIGLGETMIGDVLTDDLRFLTTLCESTEVALKNATMYQKLHRLNKKLRKEIRRDHAMHRITALATTIFDRERLVEDALRVILDWLGVASGKLSRPPDQHGYQLEAIHGMPDDTRTSIQLRGIEEEVQNSGMPKLSRIDHGDGETAQYALCLPVGPRGQDAGTLLIIGGEKLQKIYQKGIGYLTSMVNQMMLAIEHNLLMEEYFMQQREKFRIRGLFEQYVSPDIVRYLVDEGKVIELGGERKRVSIVRADISGSTLFSHREEPEVVVEVLNRFFAEMQRVVDRNTGVVDKFIGDEVMATFGLFDLQQEGLDPDPVRAVRTGLEMKRQFEEMLEDLHKGFGRDLGIGIHIGIATGEVVVGHIGSTRKVEFTVVGTPANLVARLTSLATAGQMIIDEQTYRAVKGMIEVETTRTLSLKGIMKPVKAYLVLGEKR